MPSNKELIESIHEIDENQKTDDLNNKELSALLKALKVMSPAPVYVIADGKAITSKRGIRGPGEEVTAADFPGGQSTIDAFVKSGHIVEV